MQKILKSVIYLKVAISWDFGTYHIFEHRKLIGFCADANAQIRNSIYCSHTQRTYKDQDSNQNLDI